MYIKKNKYLYTSKYQKYIASSFGYYAVTSYQAVMISLLSLLRHTQMKMQIMNMLEYEHVLDVQNKIGMKTIKDCHSLYLKYGVLLLELNNYGLCPSHYLRVPALCWDAMLKMTKTELEHIPHLDMDKFFEKYTIGEIYYISNRYRKTNNKYLKSYAQKQESKHILYLGANNLYGYV